VQCGVRGHDGITAVKEASRQFCGIDQRVTDECTMPADRSLLVDFGDLASLAALAMEADRAAVLIRPAAAAAEDHAGSFAAEVLAAPHFATVTAVPDRPLRDAMLLLDALNQAIALGCPRIIWPRQVGADLNRMANEMARVQHVTALAQLGSPRRVPVIELPVLDLDDAQLVDLCEDMGAPLNLFRPCDAERSTASEPCGECDGCRRWRNAFDEAHVPWPWALAAAAR
jgi:7-cyano-7-deazaguanine synthase in queuosine biosynthesis